MNQNILIATSLTLSCLAGIVQAAESPVYPCPQQCQLKQQYTRVKNVSIIRPGEQNNDLIWQKLPQGKEGAYAIRIQPNTVQIFSRDQLGDYYAKQTLSQLLKNVPGARNAHRDPFPNLDLTQIAQLGELPLGEIIDWPDLPFRGTVEGYYGAPWSQEARIAQFEFYGRNKMNIYIYAPKDDVFHHGQGCYKPYPKEQADQLAELVRQARKNHVRFVWAIHPANTINWNNNAGKDDMDRLCAKLQQLYDLGVRDFGVFVDDAVGEIGKADRQVTLCNYLMENFIRKHPDAYQGLIMCPTGYNKAWSNQSYLNTLGQGLEPAIHIMWTGNTVVHDITLEGQQWVNKRVQRPTFIWWNWPVNDYKRSRLCMGRTYGLDQEEEMLTAMSGFVSNPMEQAEASKIGLFSIADYTWNIGAFDSIPSWQEGIRRQYPESHAAIQTFCNHNADLLPNAHNHPREESVAAAPNAKKLRQSLETGSIDHQAASAILQEYEAIEQAARTLAQGRDTRILAREISPWIKKFRLTGKAGVSIINALLETNDQTRTKAILDTARTIHRMSAIERNQWSPSGVSKKRDVEVAMKEMTPTLQAAFREANLKLYSSLAGKSIQSLKPIFICEGGNPNNTPQHIWDGNPKSYWASGLAQQPGMWYGYDFGEPTTIKTIDLTMGGPRGNDYFEEGLLEISQDGTTWQTVGGTLGGSTISLDFTDTPLQARMLRFRITKPHKKFWMGINEFRINKDKDASVTSSIHGFKHLSTFHDQKMIGVNRVMEVTTSKPGDTIMLTFHEPVRSTWLEVNLGNKQIKDWATIEVFLEDGSIATPKFVPAQGGEALCCNGANLPTQRIKGMRLTHTGNTPQEVKLNVFKGDVPPTNPDRNKKTLTDTDFSTAYSCDQPLDLEFQIPRGTREVIIVGDATCTIPGAREITHEGDIRRFSLPENTTTIRLQAQPQPGKWIQEMITK